MDVPWEADSTFLTDDTEFHQMMQLMLTDILPEYSYFSGLSALHSDGNHVYLRDTRRDEEDMQLLNCCDTLPSFNDVFCPSDFQQQQNHELCRFFDTDMTNSDKEPKSVTDAIKQRNNSDNESVFGDDALDRSMIPKPVLEIDSETWEADVEASTSSPESETAENSCKSRLKPDLSARGPKSKPAPRRRRKEQPWKDHHLWEFMRDLLDNVGNSPAGEEVPVKWESREERVFCIVNSQLVAKLWGVKKRNDSMNYEKLSRALRWCRSSGFFAEVPKNKNYPKKLCFRFGKRADVR